MEPGSFNKHFKYASSNTHFPLNCGKQKLEILQNSKIKLLIVKSHKKQERKLKLRNSKLMGSAGKVAGSRESTPGSALTGECCYRSRNLNAFPLHSPVEYVCI